MKHQMLVKATKNWKKKTKKNSFKVFGSLEFLHFFVIIEAEDIYPIRA